MSATDARPTGWLSYKLCVVPLAYLEIARAEPLEFTVRTESFVGGIMLAGLLVVSCSNATDAGAPQNNSAGATSLAGGTSAAGGATDVPGGMGGGGASQSDNAGAGSDVGGSAGLVGSAGSASAGAAGSAAGGAGADPTDPTDLSVWELAWSDEFDAADGTAPDAMKWTREIRTQDKTGNNNSNKELQQYTADTANSQQEGGFLAITAIKTSSASGDIYTSARLNTLSHYSAAYGRIEARLKMPGGKGVWPAFWMLGDNKPSVGWPKCGEIDIMETKGSQIDTNHGSLHGPVYFGGNDLTATVSLPGKPKLSDDFHIYATEWSPDSVKFFIDSTLYETRTPKDMPAGGTWVFNHPFFITLNLAIGGMFDGDPTASTPFPATLLVDYVRVFEAK